MENEKTLGIIITSTPFRISFFGGGTDVPEQEGPRTGAVIGTTINKYNYVTINSLERLLEKKIKVSYSKLEIVEEPEDLEDEYVKVILRRNPENFKYGFLDIHSFADLPAGTGIGSSSSFVVGMLNGLHSLRGQYQSPEMLAREAIKIEREEMNLKGGWQDQIFAAYGGFNRIDFYNRNSFKVQPVVISPEKKQCLESSCLLFFTNIKRSSAAIQDQVFAKGNKENNSYYMEKVRDLVDEAAKIINADSEPEKMVKDFGMLLNESWHLKKKLAEGITNPEIEEIYKKALKAGAYGGKVCGAGGGGFFLFIVPDDKKQSVVSSLFPRSYVDLKFEEFGSRVIFANPK